MNPIVRLDDLSAEHPASWVFRDPVATGRADLLDDVIPALRAAEARAVEGGEWVVFVVAYEAAPAFDSAMVTRSAPPTGTPFVWWAAFGERFADEPLAPLASHVVDRQRSPNTMPYPDAVSDIRTRIERGDVYQVNHTDRFRGGFSGDAFEVYTGLIGVQACSHGAFVDMGDRVIASASPELFFRVVGDSISCRPMKGTAARHPRPDVDAAVGRALAASVKDRAENVMIVDLLRNDLSRIGRIGSVRVDELFRLERYETVWQLTSSVSAELAPQRSLVDLLTALFPCGSITGAPKIAAMRIIEHLENEPRGVYCGAIGVIAPPGHEPRIECSVPIRTAVLDPVERTYVYGAGGGVTWSSDPTAEDDEVRHKARILTRSNRRFDLFETLRLDDTGPLRLAEHLDRLQQSADWFDIVFDRDATEAEMRELTSREGTERLRIRLGPDGAVAIDRTPFVADDAPVVLAVDTAVTASDDPFCCHKTTYRKHYDDARARHPDADDVVLVNEFGNVVETTIANLAYRIGDQWFVPPLTDGGLAGIGRLAALRDGTVRERSLPARDLPRCAELAVVNDLRGWRSALLAGAVVCG